MLYLTNTSYDNLYTRIIVDQVFIDVKNYSYSNNFFRSPNTDTTRLRIKSGVEAVLTERQAWIAPVQQPDNTLGYNVSVTKSPSATRERSCAESTRSRSQLRCRSLSKEGREI
jgi:hypothetical protein